MAKPEGNEETPNPDKRAHRPTAKRERREATHRGTQSRASWLGKLFPYRQCRSGIQSDGSLRGSTPSPLAASAWGTTTHEATSLYLRPAPRYGPSSVDGHGAIPCASHTQKIIVKPCAGKRHARFERGCYGNGSDSLIPRHHLPMNPHTHRIADYLRPKTLAMLLLGFSSGLPFLLVGNTFGYWLRDEHSSLTAIGFLSWVGIAYSLKFLWAPVMDRVDLPLFKRLGRRRGWMMFSQILVGLALCAMGGAGTKAGLGRLGALALVVAFASSTQDIVVDAWRIESADDGEEQGLLASAYQFSYRLALLATDTVILIVAATVGWRMSYGIYGACMAIGIIATWFASEPERAAVVAGKEREAPLWTPRGFLDAVVGPFIAFFRAHGWLALVMLAAISLYRLPDFIMGPMSNPYYHDIGLSKQTVGAVRGSIGLI